MCGAHGTPLVIPGLQGGWVPEQATLAMNDLGVRLRGPASVNRVGSDWGRLQTLIRRSTTVWEHPLPHVCPTHMHTPIHHTNTHIRVKRKIIEESKKDVRKREIHSTHPLVIFDPSFDSVSKPILKSRRQKFPAQAFSLYWWCRQKIKISVTKNSKSQKQLTFGIGLATECIIQGHAHAREPQGGALTSA